MRTSESASHTTEDGARPRWWLGAISGVAAAVIIAVMAVIVLGPSTTTAPPRAGRDTTLPVTVERHLYPAASADPTQNYGDLYLPRTQHPTAVVVLIHGGGWNKRFGASVLREEAQRLAHRGVVVWNIEYRRVGSGGGWPHTFLDVAAAVDHLAALHAAHTDIDLSRVIVVGHSAGGQLAAWTASRTMLAGGEPGAHPRIVPMHVFSLAGVLDMRAAADAGNDRVTRVLGGKPLQVPARYRIASPIEHIASRIPVTLYHGLRDKLVPASQSTGYAARARAHNAPVKTVILPRATHPSLVDSASPDWHRIENDILTVAGNETHSHETTVAFDPDNRTISPGAVS